jgi:hypothetical protein
MPAIVKLAACLLCCPALLKAQQQDWQQQGEASTTQQADNLTITNQAFASSTCDSVVCL